MFLIGSGTVPLRSQQQRRCTDLLGTLLWERRDALSAPELSRGSGGLTGPGRIPAFHWARPSRLTAVPLVSVGASGV